jgi:hypothetical protein
MVPAAPASIADFQLIVFMIFSMKSQARLIPYKVLTKNMAKEIQL